MYKRFQLLTQVINEKLHNLPNSDEKIVNQVLHYADKGRITDFGWFDKFNKLQVTMKGSTKKPILISIEIDQEELLPQCNCSIFTKKLFCHHIAISFLVIQALIGKGRSHYISWYCSQNHDLSVSALLSGNCQDGSFQFSGLSNGTNICLIPNQAAIPETLTNVYVYIVKNGLIIQPSDPSLPKILHLLASNDSPHTLINHLATAGQSYPIYVGEGENYRKVTWNNKLTLGAATEIDAIDNDTLRIRRICLHKDSILNDIMRIDERLILNKSNNQLGYLSSQGTNSWKSANKWRQGVTINDASQNTGQFPTISNAFEINTSLFNSSHGVIFDKITSHALDSFIFKKNGVTISAQAHSAQCKVVAHVDERLPQNIKLKGHVAIDENLTILDTLTHDKELVESITKWPRLLSTPKQYALWRKALVAATCAETKEELSNIIDQTTVAFEKHGIDLKKIIKTIFTSSYNRLHKQYAGQIIFTNDTFYLAKVEYQKFWTMYALPRMILAEDSFYLMQNTTLSVSTHVFYDSLLQLQSLLKRHTIDLYLDTKQIKTAHIDIEIDTTSNPNTDWFEVHPDVYYQGEKLSDQEWQAIVAGKGFWDRGGNDLLIVDANMSSALNLLSQWINTELDEKSKKNSITKVPRLKILDLIELRKNGIRVKLSQKDETILQSLSRFTALPKINLPSQLQCTLRDYQAEGYYWLGFLYQHRFGACLADDMGLGKTVQAIALLGGIKEGTVQSSYESCPPHLIVVPPSLIFNWVNELKTFYPSLRVQEYHGAQRSMTFENVDILITTYDIVRRDSEDFQKLKFNVIIFDEAQAIKNIKAQRTAAARLLQGNFKLCITGTPLENNIGEYYSIMDLALPGLLPTYKTSREDGTTSDTNTIVFKTRPFILRRTKEAIANELPEKIESDMYLYMTDKQKKLYTQVAQSIKQEVSDAYQTKTTGQASIIALTALLRLRQICISADMVIPATKATPSPKIEHLTSQLQELTSEGHAALVFSQFTSCLDLIETELKSESIKYLRIDGSVPLAKRKDIIEAFQVKKTAPVLLMSLKTGGVGLNLTRASYIFHVDPWWNAAAENQASDRAYRIGQKNNVIVTRLLMHHSIEEKMLTLKKHKEELFKAIVEGAGCKSTSMLTKNDFDFLLS